MATTRTYGEVRHAMLNACGYWYIAAEPHVTMRLKRILPRTDQDRRGHVIIADSPAVCADLAWAFARWPMRMDTATANRLHEQADQHTADQARVAEILAGRAQPRRRRPPAIPPRRYQLDAAELALTTGRLLLADDVGLGKTLSSALVLREPEALPALVVTLTHLPGQWQAELNRFFPWLRCHIVTSSQPYDPARRRGAEGRSPDVLIMNYHKLAGWADVLAGQVRTVIFDEVQELRRDGTRKYTAAGRVADGARYVIGNSATPVYNYGGEIFNILDVLAPGALGTREEFHREWCGEDRPTHPHDRKVAVRNPAALGGWLRDEGLLLRRTRAEVGRELPDTVVITQPVDLDTATFSAAAADSVELARRLVERTGDPRQLFRVASDLDWRLRRATGLAKAGYVAAFVKMLVESGEQVVLYGWHRDVYDLWLDALAETRPALYTGSETPAQKQAAKQRFLAGDARVLIMSLRSGAGLDGLQGVAHVAVFGEIDWSPEIHTQCLDAATEILTPDGFATRDRVAVGSLVAAFDRANGEIYWLPATSKVDRPLAAGERMFELRTPGADLRVTGGHRMVFRDPMDESSEWNVATAETLFQRSQYFQIPVAGDEAASGVDLTDDELRLLGWWFAAGTLATPTRQLVITQSASSPHLDDIRKCLTGSGVAWAEISSTRSTQFSAKSTVIRFYIPKFRSRKYPGHGWSRYERYLDKDFPPALDQMTADQLAVFMEAVHLGDRNKQRGQSWTQRSFPIGISRRIAAERLQSLCVRRGWRANLASRLTPSGRPHYTLHCKPAPVRAIGGHDKPSLQPSPVVPGERVWCVENALGTLITRRNGKVAVVGNCVGRLARDGQTEPVVVYYLLAADGSDPVVAQTLQIKRQQAEPIRDPGLPVVSAATDNRDRVRRLAAAFLAQRERSPVPAAS